MIEKKIGRFMGISMGVTMGIFMSFTGSLHGMLVSGQFTVPRFMGSLATGIPLTIVIAILLGKIIPMKKLNDGIKAKTGLNGIMLHVVQTFVTDLIYTCIIGLFMAFLSTAAFSMPGMIRGMEAEIAGKTAGVTQLKTAIDGMSAEIAALEAQDVLTPEDTGKLEALQGELGQKQGELVQLMGELTGVTEARNNVKYLPLVFRSFFGSFLLLFAVAYVVSFIASPIYQKIAFKKYIPGYGEKVEGDEDI